MMSFRLLILFTNLFIDDFSFVMTTMSVNVSLCQRMHLNLLFRFASHATMIDQNVDELLFMIKIKFFASKVSYRKKKIKFDRYMFREWRQMCALFFCRRSILTTMWTIYMKFTHCLCRDWNVNISLNWKREMKEQQQKLLLFSCSQCAIEHVKSWLIH